jgi:single-strand DNA-binding protein
MNKVMISGRLTNDVTFYPAKSEDGAAVARFPVAIDHRKGADTTFVTCVSFGKGAEFARDFLVKGKRYMFSAHIQASKGEDGKQNGVQFVVEEVEFVEPKTEATANAE